MSPQQVATFPKPNGQILHNEICSECFNGKNSRTVFLRLSAFCRACKKLWSVGVYIDSVVSVNYLMGVKLPPDGEGNSAFPSGNLPCYEHNGQDSPGGKSMHRAEHY